MDCPGAPTCSSDPEGGVDAAGVAARFVRLLRPAGGGQGAPYVFAHHFSGRGTDEALALYRNGLPARGAADRPRTFLTVNAVVAETHEEAERLRPAATPRWCGCAPAQELGPQRPSRKPRHAGSPQHSALLEQMRQRG